MSSRSPESVRRPGALALAVRAPFEPPPLVLAATTDEADLRRRRESGTVLRVRRGAYVEREVQGAPARRLQTMALARIAAVDAQLSAPLWFSHESAALIWGCSVVVTGSTRTHVTQQVRPNGRGDRALVRHHGALPADERTTVDGLPVTTLERTVVDCASSMAPGPALVVADSALRIGADVDVIAELLAGRVGARGVRRARTVIAMADARAESPGESLVRWIVRASGPVPPEPQIEVRTRLGTFWLDLGWRDVRVCLEFDGLVKYSGAGGRTAPEAVFAEKRRQDALEELGWIVVRVTWSDLRAPAELETRVRRALRRAASR